MDHARVEPGESEQLHALLMELVRVAGLLQPDQAVPGQPVSMSQAFALHELDTAEPLSQRELADRLRLEKSSVSRLVADLERKGLLERDRTGPDRRRYGLRLTDLGRATHRRMRSVFHGRYEGWVAEMAPRERAALLEGLPALVRVIRRHWPAPD